MRVSTPEERFYRLVAAATTRMERVLTINPEDRTLSPEALDKRLAYIHGIIEDETNIRGISYGTLENDAGITASLLLPETPNDNLTHSLVKLGLRLEANSRKLTNLGNPDNLEDFISELPESVDEWARSVESTPLKP